MSSGTVMCEACNRRIRREHPHIGVIDVGTGKETNYHASCTTAAAITPVVETIGNGGGVFTLRHHHVCGDEQHGFDCSGGCFRSLAVA